MPNNRFQPTNLLSLRYGKSAAEAERRECLLSGKLHVQCM